MKYVVLVESLMTRSLSWRRKAPTWKRSRNASCLVAGFTGFILPIKNDVPVLLHDIQFCVTAKSEKNFCCAFGVTAVTDGISVCELV